MTVAVDTNVLFDIQLRDAQHFSRSAVALERAAAEDALIIGEVVYAELSVRTQSAVLDAFLADLSSLIKYIRRFARRVK